MKKNYHIEEEIERTLQSLNGMKPATPKPFFIHASKPAWKKDTDPERLAVAASVCLFGVGVGAVTQCSYYLYNHPFVHKNTQSIESFTSEYGLNNVGGIGLN
ncbi:MAG: hypothetical protein R2822_08135 [Spirosomataceae bacterium]